jgi:hypothetical protein
MRGVIYVKQPFHGFAAHRTTSAIVKDKQHNGDDDADMDQTVDWRE